MFILFGTDIQQKNPMWRMTDPVNYLEKLSKEKNSLVYRNVAYYLEPVYNLELLDNPYGIKSLMKLPISSTKEITPNSEIDISINVYTAPKEYERLLLSIRKRLMEELLKIKDNLEQK